MISVGIIGYGSFGSFLVDKLSNTLKVSVFSRRMKVGTQNFCTFDEVANCDYLILSIPLSAYEENLIKLKSLINKSTVIVDICSVKVKPVNIIKNILPNQPLVATHPLFGPETASDSLDGKVLVICSEVSNSKHAKIIEKYSKSIGLKVVNISAEEHDKEMAKIHALTFFISKSLNEFGIKSYNLSTPSYNRMLSLSELDNHHSTELFNTIQNGNPYAQKTRADFLKLINNLDSRIRNNN